MSNAVDIAMNRRSTAMYAGRPHVLLERGWIAFRSTNWVPVVTGFVEPVLFLLAFNVVDFGTSFLLIPIAVLGGGAFGAVMLFCAAKIEKEDHFFNILGRLVITPMFLFSGTFFPLESMPIYFQPIGWISPLWHATELGRSAAFDYGVSSTMTLVHILFLVALVTIGLALSFRQFERRLSK